MTDRFVTEEEAAFDAEIAALLTDEALRGQGLTAAEIANAPEFGAWEHRDDIADGASYVEKIRRQSNRERLERD